MFRINGFFKSLHLPMVWKLENTILRKLDLLPSSGEGGKTLSQLVPLERANLNHWATPVRFTTAI
jgi:hypothetical protein